MNGTSMFRGFHSLRCPKAFRAVFYATALWGTFLSPCLPSHISCLVFLDLWGLSQHINSINVIISFNWKLRKGIFVGCHKEPRFHLHFSPIPVCPNYDAECFSQCSPNSYQAGMRVCVCVFVIRLIVMFIKVTDSLSHPSHNWCTMPKRHTFVLETQ